VNPVAHRDAGTAAGHAAQQQIALDPAHTDDEPSRDPAAVLSLRAAYVSAARGAVFGPLDAESHAAVTVVLGSQGSGRTSLLLSLGGRMRLSDGSLEVLGESKAGKIRRRTGIAGFDAIDALEPSVTLGDTLRERLAWASPWYRRVPRITPERSDELLAPAFGTGDTPAVAIPHPDILVRELTPAQDLLLRISLALIEAPELLLVDDFDALRNPAERAHVADRLAALAGTGLRVVLATSDPGDVELLAHALARIDTAAGTMPAVIRL
jgi:ABC-type multidrug transport system ATPase subunit